MLYYYAWNVFFCRPEEPELSQRIVRKLRYCYSVVSNPRIRPDHGLVIPYPHVEKPAELTAEELGEIYKEVGRIGSLVDIGYGNETLQKFAPLTPDGKVKQSHLHVHILPRVEHDGVSVFSSIQGFDDFKWPSPEEIQASVRKLR